MTVWGVGLQFTVISVACLALALVAHYVWYPRFVIQGVPYAVLVAVGLLLMAVSIPIWATASHAVDQAFEEGYLATQGVYALCRHPIYGNAIFFTIPGILLFFRSWLLLLVPMAMYVRFRVLIQEEEDYLRRRFGEAYRAKGALKRLPIPLESVTHVFLSHADHDHTGKLDWFENAQVHLGEDEKQMIDGTTSRMVRIYHSPKIDRPYTLVACNRGHQGPGYRHPRSHPRLHVVPGQRQRPVHRRYAGSARWPRAPLLQTVQHGYRRPERFDQEAGQAGGSRTTVHRAHGVHQGVRPRHEAPSLSGGTILISPSPCLSPEGEGWHTIALQRRHSDGTATSHHVNPHMF